METPVKAKEQSSLQASAYDKEAELPPIGTNILNSSTVKATEGQNENTNTTISAKKEKVAKPRTRASAKKTIAALENDDKRLIQDDDNYKDKKMGKKGWWDR